MRTPRMIHAYACGRRCSLTPAGGDSYPLVYGFSAGARPCSGTALSPRSPAADGKLGGLIPEQAAPRTSRGPVAVCTPLHVSAGSHSSLHVMAPVHERAHACRV